MRIIMLLPTLLIMSCGQNEVLGSKQIEESSNTLPQMNRKNSSIDDTCSIYSELQILRKALYTKNVNQVASFFDFPIEDQGLLTFINSQQSEQKQQVTILNLSEFEEKSGKIFTDKFLIHFKNVSFDEKSNGEYIDTEWENTYGKGHVLMEKHKLSYKIERDRANFRFTTEYYEEGEKMEAVIEFVFKYSECKLKFEKSIIVG